MVRMYSSGRVTVLPKLQPSSMSKGRAGGMPEEGGRRAGAACSSGSWKEGREGGGREGGRKDRGQILKVACLTSAYQRWVFERNLETTAQPTEHAAQFG
jgi:hypothetical protein